MHVGIGSDLDGALVKNKVRMTLAALQVCRKTYIPILEKRGYSKEDVVEYRPWKLAAFPAKCVEILGVPPCEI